MEIKRFRYSDGVNDSRHLYECVEKKHLNWSFIEKYVFPIICIALVICCVIVLIWSCVHFIKELNQIQENEVAAQMEKFGYFNKQVYVLDQFQAERDATIGLLVGILSPLILGCLFVIWALASMDVYCATNSLFEKRNEIVKDTLVSKEEYANLVKEDVPYYDKYVR